MSDKGYAAKEAIRRSRIALKKGDKDLARRWAEKAASLAPNLEDVWLLLAAASSRPQLSIHYLERALAINPQSKRAQKGMAWAKKRLAPQKPPSTSSAVLDKTEKKAEKTQPTQAIQDTQKTKSTPIVVGVPLLPIQPIAETQPNQAVASKGKSRFGRQSLLVLLITIFFASIIWALMPRFTTFAATMNAPPTATFSQKHWGEAEMNKPTYTPSPTATFTPTNTPLATSTPTNTPIPTETLVPTKEPVPTAAEKAAEEADEEEEYSYGGWKYVLIDISDQHLYAYEGDTLVYSFVASTGMNNATATGSFSILNKIPNAYGATWDIWMPSWLGIYWVGSMQNGIHALPIMSNGATLWDGYLGTPISYGCIVLGSYEAQLLYNWVDIGTPVDIQW